MIEELIQKLQNEHGLSADQSQGILGTITNFIKEKVPMAGGMIDQLLGHQTTANTATQPTDAPHTGGGLMDSVSSFLPAGAEEKAEELLGDLKGKFGGLFGS